MRSVIRWAIKNSPAMNTFLIASLIVGAVSMVIMQREVFPNFALEIVLVSVPFPGATPDETEEGICQKIESAVANIDGVKKMTSVAMESFGYVILELSNSSGDVQTVLNDVRSAIDQISTFPPNAEDPDVKQIVFRAPAISVGILAPKYCRTATPQDEFEIAGRVKKEREKFLAEHDRAPTAEEEIEHERKIREELLARPPTLQEEVELRNLAEQVRSELLELRPVPPASLARRLTAPLFQPKGPAISSAEIASARPFEISIEVSEDNLKKYGLSLQTISQIIRQQNADTPGGTMETPSQELLLRGNNKREIGTEIAELPIKVASGTGKPLSVGDIANVVDGFAETSSAHVINGRAGLVVRVSKTAEEDLFTIVETVKDYVSKRDYPANYSIETWGDISVDVKDRIDLLTRNGFQGLILVFIVLAVFLDLRLAFWVAMGIPISILGAGFVLLAAGQSLNMLSMFAFLMALGIVVDDAIVIGENIYSKREEGMNFVKAAVEGTAEVLPAVCASVATTIIAFLPLMYVTGVMGKFIEIMPVAVIAMLVVSLIESMFILPAHLAHENNLFMRTIGSVFYVFKPLLRVFKAINRLAAAFTEWSIDKLYEPLLFWSLHNKRIVLATVTALFLFAIGLALSGIVPSSLMPKMDGREISATVAFPNGSPEEFSLAAVDELEQAILAIDADIFEDSLKEFGKGVHVISKDGTGKLGVDESGVPFKRPGAPNIYRRIGEVGDSNLGPAGITNGSHVGSVEVQLIDSDQRPTSYKYGDNDGDLSTARLNELWRQKMKNRIAGAEVLKFSMRSMGPGGVAIEFKLMSDEKSVDLVDKDTGQSVYSMAIDDCKEYLASKLGVSDIEDDARQGKVEQILRLNELGRTLGLDESSLASTIRDGYFGAEVMRLQRGRHEVKLMVRYPREARENMEDFEQIRIRDNEGVERPLLEVADVEQRRAYSEINRLDQRRSITVSADVDDQKANAKEIIDEMKSVFIPKLVTDYRDEYGANFSVNWEGEQAQNDESVASMFQGFIVALMGMFVLLTLQFRSYVQPAIILAIIPFGWLGAILGHYVMDINLTLFSFFGLIALTGVIVNDSIVLVDYINQKIRQGTPLFDALMIAGRRRFRPIMLTSFTTVAGLFPILLETSLQAQVLIPMAASLIFGLMTGTILILILVPVFYHIYGTLLIRLNMPLNPDDDDRPDDFSGDQGPDQPHGHQTEEDRVLEPMLAREMG